MWIYQPWSPLAKIAGWCLNHPPQSWGFYGQPGPFGCLHPNHWGYWPEFLVSEMYDTTWSLVGIDNNTLINSHVPTDSVSQPFNICYSGGVNIRIPITSNFHPLVSRTVFWLFNFKGVTHPFERLPTGKLSSYCFRRVFDCSSPNVFTFLLRWGCAWS